MVTELLALRPSLGKMARARFGDPTVALFLDGSMLRRLVMYIVDWCWCHAWTVIVATLLLTVGLGYYAATHLGLDTDESRLISSDLPFRQAEQRMDQAFPQDVDLLVIVIDGPTSDRAEQAVNALLARLAPRSDLFRSVRRPAEELFFRKNGLLFLSTEELTELSDRLVAAQPLLGTLARDPSLRGLLSSINLALEGVARGQMDLKDMAPMFKRLDDAAANIATGKQASPLSWQSLFGPAAEHDTTRRFLLSQPILQYGELVAGRQASDAVRQAATELGLTPEHGYSVRLTGSVALADANFATVTQGVKVSTPIMLVAICILLYLAVRSVRAAGAILLSTVVGLVATAAFAAATVGTLNPISVAFAVMFVGIAVDFAIQLVVRYRDERYRVGDLATAMRACAKEMAAPLTLAAAATAVGFLSFLPTAYTGVSQLGLIAGGGMLIALIIDFTFLPAVLALFQPRPVLAPVGLPLAAADRWLSRHCVPVVVIAFALALAGLAASPFLPMDFNPLKLQNPKDEAVATFNDLTHDPENATYAINALAPSPAEAAQMAQALEQLPEVGRTMSIETFVPDEQDDKLAIIQDLAGLLGPTLNPPERLPPPSAEDLRKVLTATADKLEAVAPANASAHSLAEHLRAVGKASPQAALALQDALVTGLPAQLDQLRTVLDVRRISLDTLPASLTRNWVSDQGQARIEALPKGNMQDEKELIRYVKAVRSIAPNTTGMPVSIEQSGLVVVKAFARAGLSALIAIAILLWLMLRRVLDALLVVLPLIMGALYTVIGCIFFDLSINFANIIALPLLLGIGVAFNIYFVVNWRNGVTGHLESATTRAVLFSALTTGSAFGSLALSPHLGTASMGLLLFLSLGLSVITTFVVLPALFFAMSRLKR
jgi:uncharacterized protein